MEWELEVWLKLFASLNRSLERSEQIYDVFKHRKPEKNARIQNFVNLHILDFINIKKKTLRNNLISSRTIQLLSHSFLESAFFGCFLQW